MNSENRIGRIADTLERHLARCDATLAACVQGRSPEVLINDWPFKRMLYLMKMSTQLANAIARLDAHSASRVAKSEV